MKKRLIAMILTLTLVIGMLTGCMGEQVTVVVNGDGACSFAIRYLVEKSTYDYLAISGDASFLNEYFADAVASMEEINQKTYHVFARNFTFASFQEMQAFLTDKKVYKQTLSKDSVNPSVYKGSEALFSSLILDTSQFIGEINRYGDLAMVADGTDETLDEEQQQDMSALGYENAMDYYKSLGMLMDISITLPGPIQESNGTISGNTANWNLDNFPMDMKLVASTGTPISGDTTAPVIKVEIAAALFNESSCIVTVTDDICLKSVTVNGKPCSSSQIELYKTGKYTIVATDANNNTAEKTFRVDLTPPKIKGVKSGKTYRRPVKLRFSDNDKIKSVEVNGKNKGKKKKLTLKKPGIYSVEVADRSGNRNRVYFRIKKKKK